MTQEEKDSILDNIRQLRELDIRKQMQDAFPEDDLTTKSLHESLTYSEGAFLVERSLDQFEEFLKGDLWRYVPNKFNGDSNQEEVISNHFGWLRNYITQKAWGNVQKNISSIVAYQIEKGFWSESERKVHHVDELKLKKQQGILSDLIASANRSSEILTAKISELEILQKEMLDFHAQKQAELQTISNSVSTVNSQASTISSQANEAATKFGELTAKVEEWKKVIGELEDRKKKEGSELEKIQLENEVFRKDMTGHFGEVSKQLGDTEKLRAEMEGKRTEINKLLGLAADGALGVWFDNRKKGLRTRLIILASAVPIFTVGSFVWAGYLFSQDVDPGVNVYLNMGLNILKTLPAFIILAFVMRQYTRERLMEEEYAFRAAISKTIKTYADMLAYDEEDDPSTSRTEMLREVLRQVYSMPQIHTERRGGFLRLRSHDLPDAVKQLNDSIGSLNDLIGKVKP